MLLWLLGAIVFTAASVNVGMNLLKHTPDRDLMLANVEALADGESGGRTFWCTTYTQEVGYEYHQWYSDCEGQVSYVEIVKACNNGFFSYCYPGTIQQFYDCSGYCYREIDNTYISGCL